MKGIQKHTHTDRTSTIQQLIPYLKEKFQKNYEAFAADGSYARNEDTDYSDLELIVFLKKLPDEHWEIRKIINGLLVVVVAETKQSFIKKYIEITGVWYASGAGKLLAIENEEFIAEINNFQPTNLHEKCLKEIEDRWPYYQEITSKVLNAINQNNHELLALAFPEMVKEILILLSFLNITPYKTLGTYIAQAKSFEIKPQSFEVLLNIYLKGNYQASEKITKAIFTELEEILESKGVKLNTNNF